MKNIYLVQASSMYSPEIPLPYSVAMLEAYALQNKKIRDNYSFKEFIFEKKKSCEIIELLENPFLIGFSCYIWNYEYNLKLAEEVKRVFPKVKILFGGHSVPINSTALLEKNDFIDYLIYGEGEIAFSKLLVAIGDGSSLKKIANIAYRDKEKVVQTGIDDTQILKQFPSPYKMGLLDSIIEKNKDKYHFTGTLETNRGCPFSCGYCDWGLNRVPVRKMAYENVIEDIEWMGKHGIYTCYGADSNFGMFEQDANYAKALIEAKRQYGFPKRFYVSFSKKSDERVFNITKAFNEANMLQGATLSFQSLNEATLEAIGRKNMGLEKFCGLMKKYNLNGIKTYSEIILGLPNESFNTFIKGLGLLMENGQHHSINIYNFELLPNSNLGQPQEIERYGIKTRIVPFRRFDVLKADEVQENSNLVMETNTLPFIDWCKAHLFGCMVRALHCGMLTDCMAMYCFEHRKIPYQDFYRKIFEHFMKLGTDTPLGKVFFEIRNLLYKIGHSDFSWNVNIPEENIYETSFENAIKKVFIQYYEEIVEDIMNLHENSKTDLHNQITEYQKIVIRAMVLREKCSSYKFTYNLHEYFDSVYLNQPIKILEKEEDITLDQIKHFYHCGYQRE